MSINVYGIPGSPFLRSVEIALREKDLPYQLHAMAPGETKQPEHLARHPFGRIPAFEHDGFTIYETQAIIRYLDDVFPHPPLTPGNAQQRTRMNQVIGIIEWYFFPKAVAPIAFNRIIGPRLLGLPGDEAAVTEAMPMAETCFQVLDGILGEKPYLTGDNASIADIMLAAQLDLLSECREGRQLIDGTSNLPAWLNRMTARSSFVATEPPEFLREAA
ncbi:MAG: glutathione S-transferase [Sphingomonadales bacterium]|jgi:glutathione S-transferase|nr:glutathione S-transferase [Sphingomonadales bacterium]